MGWEGSLCLGLVTLEHLALPPRPPTQDGHPGVGAGMGLGSRGRGAPGVPSLVFLERLNRKCLAMGGPLCSTGAQRCWHPLRQNSPPHPGSHELQSFWGPSCNAPPWLCPLWGKIKVQTVVPLWAERHQGGGVAPGCKALAEEAWGGGDTGFPRPRPCPPAPQHGRMLGGHPALPIGPTGDPHLFEGSIAMRGRGLEVAGLWGRDGDAHGHSHVSAGQRGAGGGNQALNPLTVTSHLLWVNAGGGDLPSQGSVDGDSR